jgi:hypothetical protein
MGISFHSADGAALQDVVKLLKVWYKDGVENLMFRNSPVLKMIKKERVEGKVQAFNAMYGRGGAVAGNFKIAAQDAADNTKDAEFGVSPGQLFSCYSITAKEIVAARTQRGAYMPIAGAKMFTAAEAFRKTLAAALYGMGYGEIAYVNATAIPTTATDSDGLPNSVEFWYYVGTDRTRTLTGTQMTEADLYLSDSALMKIDVGSNLVLKTKIVGADAFTSSSTNVVLKVKKLDGKVAHCDVITPHDVTSAKDLVVCIAGCCAATADGNGIAAPYLPVGLSAWLPYLDSRDASNAEWTSYIATSFMMVDRSVSTERLAGQFTLAETETVGGSTVVEPIYKTILRLIRLCRRAGSLCDMIIMNDEDYMSLTQELTPYQSHGIYANIKDKNKNTPTIGMSSLQVGFSTTWLERCIDDPYCPKGVIYIVDSEALKLWSYTNVDSSLNDNVAGNEPGKPDVTEQGDKTPEKPYQLLIDDFITIDGGEATIDGAAARVTMNFFGSFVVLDPAVCGVALLRNSTTAGDYVKAIGSKYYTVADA